MSPVRPSEATHGGREAAEINAGEINVRGNPSAEEIAAILATLQRISARPSGYARWRAGRIAAVRRMPAG